MRLKKIAKTGKYKKWDDAIWQYLLDHARFINKDGLIQILINVRNRDEFFWRVKARQVGVRRADENHFDDLQKEYEQLMWHMRNKERLDDILTSIDRGSSIKYKFLLFLYRKSRDLLFKSSQD